MIVKMDLLVGLLSISGDYKHHKSQLEVPRCEIIKIAIDSP